jgi:hypothetical protein
MTDPEWNFGIRTGTAAGTLLVVLANLGEDILHTAILSAVGAVVSLTISWLLKRLFQHFSK